MSSSPQAECKDFLKHYRACNGKNRPSSMKLYNSFFFKLIPYNVFRKLICLRTNIYHCAKCQGLYIFSYYLSKFYGLILHDSWNMCRIIYQLCYNQKLYILNLGFRK